MPKRASRKGLSTMDEFEAYLKKFPPKPPPAALSGKILEQIASAGKIIPQARPPLIERLWRSPWYWGMAAASLLVLLATYHLDSARHAARLDEILSAGAATRNSHAQSSEPRGIRLSELYARQELLCELLGKESPCM